MIRRTLSIFLTILTLHLCCGIGPVLAQSAATASSGPDAALIEPAAAPAEVPQSVFKSGVKYDPTSHQWLDRYNGKPVALGLPGVADRYGASNVIAANTDPNQGSSNTTSSSNTFTFSYKKLLIFTLLGLTIATSIAVPIACGSAYWQSHQHHQNNTVQNNQVAAYYFFHNETYPPFKLILPPPKPPSGPLP